MRLLLVRHGHTASNAISALDTALPGAPLDETGQAQAQALVTTLREQGLLEAINSLWVSPVLRARQSIAPLELALRQQAQVRDGLREVLAGDLEMANDPDSIRCWVDTTRSWMVGRTYCRLPGSPENGAQTLARFDDVVTEAWRTTTTTDPNATALLLAHGTILRLWTSRKAAAAQGATAAWIAEHPMGNTAITGVEGDPERGWRLAGWNNGEWVPQP
ncbi:alpha-ribazole phosphatase [Actinomyces bovis]|uniref:Alpha-ribazole phosphatase n=1 Tax=Actinomyces bovis TaxID=1658 RepID=A0ABY1VPR9_9ACTO|nr:histidine phosphatase family protein [Actinomyces bovis]SPT54123.1 alpha-ribazole phosphatase [Actinomyces bovis]VEG53633.1 alpha-ribazole phosphatase [Actinomyces israelii]